MSEIFGPQDDQSGVALLEPSVPRATLDDGEVVDPRSTGKLQAGSHARIYRDGQVLEGMVLVPVKGNLSLRHLAPGSYVLRDESGNEVAVKVGALEEDAVVQVSGGAPGIDSGTAEPGSAVVQTEDVERNTQPALSELTPKFPNVGPGPERADGGDLIRPEQPTRTKLSPEDAERDDVVSPAEPGSALITPEEAVTTDAEIPEDAGKGVVTEPTDQGEDPSLAHLAPTSQERRTAEQQKAELTGAGPAIDGDAHTKAELRRLAKDEGVSQRGTKSEVAARINAHRAQ